MVATPLSRPLITNPFALESINPMTSNHPETPNPAPIARMFSPTLFRWAGYGLLILTLMDFVAIVFPPRFMNPAWEFESMGAIIERIPVPLLAIAMIFFGEGYARSKWEPAVLKTLSWLCLVGGILLLLMIPLGVTNTMRLNAQNQTQLSGQYSQQMEQLKAFEERLNQASPSEIQSFLESQGLTIDTSSGKAPKEQILNQLNQVKQRLETQVEAEQTSRRNALIESSVKWNLGALIAGFLFTYTWKLTRWARSGGKRKRNKVVKEAPSET